MSSFFAWLVVRVKRSILHAAKLVGIRRLLRRQSSLARYPHVLPRSLITVVVRPLVLLGTLELVQLHPLVAFSHLISIVVIAIGVSAIKVVLEPGFIDPAAS